MTDKTYNGWTNYETWRVDLEIFDGLEKQEMFDLTLGICVTYCRTTLKK